MVRVDSHDSYENRNGDQYKSFATTCQKPQKWPSITIRRRKFKCEFGVYTYFSKAEEAVSAIVDTALAAILDI